MLSSTNAALLSNLLIELALGGIDRQIPFLRIKENQKAYIKPVYLPKKFTLQRPHAMMVGQIMAFFEHVYTRQQDHGAQDAFRFSHVEIHQKNETLRKSHYPDEESDEEVTQPARPPPRPKKTTRAPPKASAAAGPSGTHDVPIAGPASTPAANLNPNDVLMADPESTPAGQLRPDDVPMAGPSTNQTLSHIQLQQLSLSLHSGPAPIPINGPNEGGMPQYPVSPNMYNQIAATPMSGSTWQFTFPRTVQGNVALPLTPRMTPGGDEDAPPVPSTSRTAAPRKNARQKRAVEPPADAAGTDDGPRRSARHKIVPEPVVKRSARARR
jgi:hypothetical protein